MNGINTQMDTLVEEDSSGRKCGRQDLSDVQRTRTDGLTTNVSRDELGCSRLWYRR